ncbi:thiamine ABC transporter substrate-binding protein [Citricoccus muralis]|uniref:Thiamine ABC transporter substrate-binding protein n=1 Tax=Citricoccus muralis TaxID=169134 RepID=A0ABY8H511_9MICC|nr:thiamine ABC transporter substrate-binding protein [Citricoccus muralis]WFP16219.1 thiamine ABC transporter substrate-binding protein [Citricoccus muralis]
MLNPTSTRRARTALTVSGLAVVSTLALAGCSLTGGSGDSNGSDEAGESGGTVTIMTHDSFAISEEQIAEFEEQSGYELVTTAPGDSGALVNQLILQKDSPTVDGVYGIEDYSTAPLVDEGVMAEYSSEALPDSAQELLADGDAVGYFTPIDQGQVCINVDDAWFADDASNTDELAAPTSLEQLRDPEYAELLTVIDPNTSSPGLAFLAATATAYPDGEWENYWSDLLDGGATVASGWSDAYYVEFSGSDGEGPSPLVLSYSSSPAYEPTTSIIEDSCSPQVEYAGVVEGAQNPEGAQAFIDFLLSEDFQASLPEAMYMYPVDDSVELPTEWTENAQLAEDPIRPDTAEVAEQRADWLTTWTELYES